MINPETGEEMFETEEKRIARAEELLKEKQEEEKLLDEIESLKKQILEMKLPTPDLYEGDDALMKPNIEN